MKTLFSLSLTSVLLSTACHTQKTRSASEFRSEEPKEILNGSFRAVQIQGYETLNHIAVNMSVKLTKGSLNQDLMDMKISLNDRGEGSMTGQTLCEKVRTPLGEDHSFLLITFGLSSGGSSFVSTRSDVAKCKSSGEKVVTSTLKIAPSLDENGKPSAHLPDFTAMPNELNSFVSKFRLADSECKKLRKVRYISLVTGNEQIPQSTACIGLTGNLVSEKLRMILLPARQGGIFHAFVADYERISEH